MCLYLLCNTFVDHINHTYSIAYKKLRTLVKQAWIYPNMHSNSFWNTYHLELLDERTYNCSLFSEQQRQAAYHISTKHITLQGDPSWEVQNKYIKNILEN